MNVWAITLIHAAALGPAQAARPVGLPTEQREGIAAAAAALQDAPAGWTRIEEFEGVPVEEYRESHPLSGRLSVIGTRTAEGQSHGPEWNYWPNGGAHIQRVWVLGKLEGHYKAWFRSGMQRLEGDFKQDGREGTWRKYAESGHVISLNEYAEGLPHGAFREFWSNGEDRSERHFEKGVQTGAEWVWSAKGEVLLEGHWLAGKRHGAWADLRQKAGPDQQLGNYVHGAREGVWTERTAEGQKISEVTFVEDRMHGLRITWRADGSHATEATFEAGLETGPFTAWFSDGQKQMQGRKVDGKREGSWSYWRADGTLNPTFTGTYAADVKVSD